MCVYIYMHIHIYSHTYIHTCIHTYIHLCIFIVAQRAGVFRRTTVPPCPFPPRSPGGCRRWNRPKVPRILARLPNYKKKKFPKKNIFCLRRYKGHRSELRIDAQVFIRSLQMEDGVFNNCSLLNVRPIFRPYMSSMTNFVWKPRALDADLT